jgi:hypothetical protein
MEDFMGENRFLELLALLVIYAFAICDTLVALVFILVFGKMGIRHLLEIDRRSKSAAPLEGSDPRGSRNPSSFPNITKRKVVLAVRERRHEG